MQHILKILQMEWFEWIFYTQVIGIVIVVLCSQFAKFQLYELNFCWLNEGEYKGYVFELLVNLCTTYIQLTFDK